MTLDQLKVIDIIMKTGSFRAAAAELHRAQSAVSYAVKTLEEELGFSLFSRESYRPKLTAEGRAIHNKAKAILAQAEEFEVLGRQLSLGTEAALDISISAIIDFAEVVKKLKELPIIFPDTQLSIHHDPLRLPFEKLMDGKVCLAIIPFTSGSEQLERVPWGKVKLYPVCSPNFTAREITTKLSWADMFHYTQIVVMDPPLVKQETMANVVEGAKRWRVPDFAAMKELILHGVGWGYLPEYMILPDLKRHRLSVLDLESGSEMVDLYLARRRNIPLGPCAQKVWELLKPKD